MEIMGQEKDSDLDPFILFNIYIPLIKTITLNQSKLYIDMCEDVDYDMYFETEGVVA
jgi:hypothetical protein